MPIRRIVFAESAIADLEGVRSWYEEQGVPEIGERLLGEIMAHVERLAEFPESGRVVPEFGVAQLREIIHRPFRIVYRLDGEQVRVVRVWRAERRMDVPED